MKDILQRVNLYLLAAILLTIVLYFGKPIVIPLMFAIFFSMLMAPVCRWLDKKGLHRALSCLICILILFTGVLTMLAIAGAQVAVFAKDIPQIEAKANELIGSLHGFVEDRFDVSNAEQKEFTRKQIAALGKSTGGFISTFFSGMVTTIASLILTLVFTFLFLFNKEKYDDFFVWLYHEEDPKKVKAIVNKISAVAQKYLTGRAMSIIILWVLYSVGLLIVGVKNAILLAGIAALLTVVPYVGSTLGGLFPFLMALVTEDSINPALAVVGVIVFIQAMDNYFIEPNIVGGEVSLSALTSILSIVCGGLIWGVAGMILFIPMVGIAKIVFDNVESLKPYGYLIGDPRANKPNFIKEWFLKIFGKNDRPVKSYVKQLAGRSIINKDRLTAPCFHFVTSLISINSPLSNRSTRLRIPSSAKIRNSP
jgi:predicted PurR-regulated permease PerM